MAALATIPAAIQSDPASWNLDPLKLDAFRAFVGPVDYDTTPINIQPGIKAYDDGPNRLITSENPSYQLKAGADDLILLNTAWRGIGNAGNNVMLGNDASNHLDGRAGNDVIIGAGGNDVVEGGSGDDFLIGCTGDDDLRGGSGNDLILGQDDDDILFGGAGRDELVGGEGNDVIDGGVGSDFLLGEGGVDQILGGAGDDLVFGGFGNDTIDGGGGNDILFGGDLKTAFASGDDSISGGGGNDLIFGDDGNDSLDGGAGNDTIIGAEGDDVVFVGNKGNGKDVFVWFDGDGNDTVRGLDNKDKLDFSGADSGDAGSDVTVLFTQVGADTHVEMEDGSIIVLKDVNKDDLQDNDGDDIWDID